MDKLATFALLLIATVLEASGDAIVRRALGESAVLVRVGWFLAGAGLLFGYGLFLNLAPAPFERIIGLYIATLFVVWQVVNLIIFHRLPAMPVFVGGALIVMGGLIVTFWQTNAERA